MLLELYAVLADERDAEALMRNVMRSVLQVGGTATSAQERFNNKQVVQAWVWMYMDIYRYLCVCVCESE